jgi:hypothetical protein
VTPSHIALPLSCLTRAATEEAETNIAVDGNEREDTKKGGGRSIVVALAVSDSTIPPTPSSSHCRHRCPLGTASSAAWDCACERK